jgi:hypothetical protein
MVFHLLNTIVPQSVLGLTLDETVNKVNALTTPSEGWDFIQLNLLSQYFLSDFLSILPDIRSLK